MQENLWSSPAPHSRSEQGTDAPLTLQISEEEMDEFLSILFGASLSLYHLFFVPMEQEEPEAFC